MRTAVGALCCTLAAASLTACSSTEPAVSPTTVYRTIVRTASAASAPSHRATTSDGPSSAAKPASDIGKPVRNFGAEVTVHNVERVDSIVLDGKTHKARLGGQYVVVSTTVLNKAKASMDLTCSLPIQTELIDNTGTQYDSIDDLYELAGNPECNASLNPGFSHRMTWAFLIPRTARVVGMSILEMTKNFRDASDATTIRFVV